MKWTTALGAALLGAALAAAPHGGTASAQKARSQRAPSTTALFNDVHLHLTNYVQEGVTARELLKVLGDRVDRAVLFGIPLQQTWSYRISGDFAPTYYLQSDAPLYYYSFTDAAIAMAYLGLSKAEQARFDPMITGFNPADGYAADHIRRVLETFPGVFSGIGEFTIHKEFVSSKIAGVTPSLTDPALDRLLDFAGVVGLVALIHNDADIPFAKEGASPVYLEQVKALFRRHPKTTIIWAHIGLGRVIHPLENSLAVVEGILNDPGLAHVSFDISWIELAKYIVATPTTIQRAAGVLNRYPERFIFGSDEVAPTQVKAYLSVYEAYEPVWKQLKPEAREKVLKGNYLRIFDEARRRVRAWEKANVKGQGRVPVKGGGPPKP